MPNSKQIVYLSQSQYAELITNGTITVDGVTVTYNENDIYVTPQAEPVTDVRVNGTSVTANGVANVPMASTNTYGVVRTYDLYGTQIITGGYIGLVPAVDRNFKEKSGTYKAVVGENAHRAIFWGLANAAGDTTQSQSNNTVGTYTPGAKAAIQSMLGVSDLIATAENTLVASKAYAVGDTFTANGKLYKVTTAITTGETIVVQDEGETVSGHNAEEVKVTDYAVHDVQVDGTSIISNGVANLSYPTANVPGVITINQAYSGLKMNGSRLEVLYATSAQAKAGSSEAAWRNPIYPGNQHESTFYGLAKAAGADMKDIASTTVGIYPDAQKAAIQHMLGTDTNLADYESDTTADQAYAIGELFMLNGKLHQATAAIAIGNTFTVGTNCAIVNAADVFTRDVQVNGTSIVSNGVANVPAATFGGNYGTVKLAAGNGIGLSGANNLIIATANDAAIKAGTNSYTPLTPYNQHSSSFYGLAKAAGDTTQSQSDNAVGTYTDDAKAAIRTMLGAVGTTDYAANNAFGITKANLGAGIGVDSVSYTLYVNGASSADIKTGTHIYKPILPVRQHESVFYGLAKASGDTTQSASANAVGLYTDNAKASIKSMLGIVDGSTGTVSVSGTTPTITAVENTRYVCGEVATLSFTPPASGISIVRFISGTTATVLTLPNTVIFPEWFDATDLEVNTIYEMCITDGIYGAVMSWAQ